MISVAGVKLVMVAVLTHPHPHPHPHPSHLVSQFYDTVDLKNQGTGNTLLDSFLEGDEKSVCSGAS